MTQKINTGISTLRWISRVADGKKRYIVILLLIQAVLGISSVYYAVILRNVIDEAVGKNLTGFLWWIGIFSDLVVFQISLRAVNRFLEEYTKASVENRFKEKLLTNLLNRDYAKVTAVHSGEWMNRLTSDTVVVADGLTQIVPGAAGMLVKIIGALIMIFVLEPKFGYILIPGGVLIIVLTYGFRKVLKKLHKKVQESDGDLRVFLQESLGSMQVVRAFVKEKQTITYADDKMRVHKKARMKKNCFSNVCNIGFGAVMNGAYVLGAAYCGYGMLTGTITYGTLMAILQLISQVQSPFANITGYLPKYYAMVASAERLMEVESYKLSSMEKVKSLQEIQELYRSDFTGLSIIQASFTYEPPVNGSEHGMPVILKNVNLKIKKGEYIALTGPSGCGKSTVLKLLMCLYPLDTGEEFLITDSGNIPLTADYRRLFAYVPQGNHLMSGTIGEIIAFYDPEGMKNTDKIWQALSIACADEFVKKLEQGIDTVLGEHGMGLSEGQMQRIAIARAVFSEHPVLMLDESTSALDEQTETRLLYNLRSMTDKTVLIVTHRKAVLQICHKEICFSDGMVYEKTVTKQ